jgi:thioredoxin 1|tara:strand:- start:4731 stop:5012 length:282 start_codon:yes stop_codon:yes gene_type:complete
MNKEDLKSGRILVDFYADWCGPCKMLSRQLEKYQEEVTSVNVIKINVDTEPEMAQEFGVRSLPTLIYMEEGTVIDKTTGLKQINELKQFTKTE